MNKYRELFEKYVSEVGRAPHALTRVWVLGFCDWLASNESEPKPLTPDAPKPFVNWCNPVNGVHAPFCNGDHSASDLETCQTCNGIKYIAGTKSTPDKQCPECKGRGLTPRAPDVCPRCEGAGKYADFIGTRVCSLCDGTGKRR